MRTSIDTFNTGPVLMQALDAAISNHGDIHLSLPEFSKKFILRNPRDEQLQYALDFAFGHNCQLPTHRSNRVKKFAKDIGATMDLAGESPGIALNLPKFMCLPCQDIAQELSEVRGFLEWVKECMASDPSRNIRMQVLNERDEHKKVYGSYRIGDEEDVALNQELESRISASPVLQHLVHEVALSLGKLGPYSWMTVTQDALFHHMDEPHKNFELQKIMAEIEAEKEAAIKP